jgi:Asp-tRNA(Asn)/Glu-tRNA(Gln) amidotransferase A subunit family amidase
MGEKITRRKALKMGTTAAFTTAIGPRVFSGSGLPIGIQIVGRHNDDWGVLQMAYAFEQATNVGKRRPALV